MLKRNFYLDDAHTIIGKRVYARGRPDMVGIITEVRRVHPQHSQTTSGYNFTEVRVYYCRSHRTSKWQPCHYHFCDLDAYFHECSNIYTQGELLMQAAHQGEEELRKRNGNQAGQ